ncbi:hypothetical protein GTR02_14850 [Kineococcus sp. R8]|uniref:hypothetical protein n=1 Tax=Kineococcus siccus TaxID=2696567 RepID=UPI00141348F9|nr:hypothetical protein [Kineococcus siccus]NAZ83096.1 hypothetical protein [Kineococcus siccus]
MKRVLAWFLLLAGLGCAVAGTLLLTVLAPPRQLDVTESAPEPGTAVVTAPGLLELTGPQAALRASGTPQQQVFLGVARAADVAAWLGDASRTELTGVRGELESPSFTTRETPGAAAVDPRTADIWLASASGAGTAELDWPRTASADVEGGVVALAATDGTAAAPGTVSITWQLQGEQAEHPSAVPLVAAGAGALLLGAVGLLLTGRKGTP